MSEYKLKKIVAPQLNEQPYGQNLKEQFVTFLSILAHERLQCLHRRRLYLLKTIEGIDLLDGVEDIVAFGHLNGPKISRTFWY